MKYTVSLILCFIAANAFCQKTPTDEQIIEFITQSYRPSENFNPIIAQPLNAKYLHYNVVQDGVNTPICITQTRVNLNGRLNTIFCRFTLVQDSFVPNSIFGTEKYSLIDLTNDGIPEVTGIGDIETSIYGEERNFYIYSLSKSIKPATIFYDQELSIQRLDSFPLISHLNFDFLYEEPMLIYLKVLKRKFVDKDNDGVKEMFVKYKYGYLFGINNKKELICKYFTVKKLFRWTDGIYKATTL